jgi:hypothetical protein
MRFLLPLSVFALLGVQGCAAATGGLTDQTQADLQGPAGEATTIVACTDTDDPTMDAKLTIDPSFRFSWKVGDMKPDVSTLTEATKRVQDGVTSYSFRIASGKYISLDIGKDYTTVGFSAYYAGCSPKTVVDESAIAPLLAATSSSVDRQKAFATCTFHGEGAEVPYQDTFTVRPSLDGHGAIFEQASNEEEDQSFVLLAREVTQSIGDQRSTYKGEGGVAVFAAGQHVSSVTELTVSGASPASIQWNWQQQLPSNECEVTGADYAASLLR